MSDTEKSEYYYRSSQLGHAHAYLLPAIERILGNLDLENSTVFDLGCGNGSVANWLTENGFTVSGVDPSVSGIKAANEAHPNIDLRVGSAYDPLQESFGTFPVVISLEVIEHLYSPREFAKVVNDLLVPGGYALISTPYHGYLKNLAIALAGKFDNHFTALWDHGHIKFWSANTITQLLNEAGLEVVQIERVGRVPALAKSMIVVARKKLEN